MSSQYPFSPVLSDISIARGLGRPGVGTVIAPLKFESDLKYEYPVFEDHRGTGTIDSQRAPGAEVKTILNDGYVMEGGIIKDHSIDVKSPIEFDAGTIARQINQYDRAVGKANEVIRRVHETKVRDKFWAANLAGFQALYGSTKVENLTGTARWFSTAPKMRKNVLDLNEKIIDDTGYAANTLVLTAELFNHITSADNELREVIKYTQFGVPTLQTLAQYFQVSEVAVAGISFDTANPALDPVYTKLYTGAHALLFYRDPNPGRDSMNLGTTFAADNATDSEIGPFLGIQPWYDMKRKSHMLRCNAYFDVKAINYKAGAVIFNTP